MVLELDVVSFERQYHENYYEIDGTKFYFVRENGIDKIHREDGPAIITLDETHEEWVLNGKFIDFEKPDNWDKLVAQYRAQKLLEE